MRQTEHENITTSVYSKNTPDDVLTARIAHLSFIQGVVARMATNSFYLKGWSVAILTGLFTLAVHDADGLFTYLAFLPLIAFWILDAYFLHLEKIYRQLYLKVSTGKISSDHFVMDGRLVEKEVPSVTRLAFSKTMVSFYGSMLLITIGIHSIKHSIFFW